MQDIASSVLCPGGARPLGFRVTLDLYAQVVTEQHKAAVDAMAARFLDSGPAGWTRDAVAPAGTGDGADTRREGL